MSSRYGAERAWAVDVAREMGEILLSAYGRVTAREKRPFDLVTDADLASQALFARRLADRFVGHGLLAEEDDARADSTHVWRWIVDPLDGTVNFAHGFPFWCVSVGLEHAGELVVGVIYEPLTHRVFSAEVGQGAEVDGRPMRVSGVDSLSRGLITAGWPTVLEADANRQLELIRRFSHGTHSVRRTGSSALNLAILASGGCEACYATSVHSWDVAAGIVLVREAGGQVTDIAGQPYAVDDGRTILATNRLVHGESLQHFREVGDAGAG